MVLLGKLEPKHVDVWCQPVHKYINKNLILLGGSGALVVPYLVIHIPPAGLTSPMEKAVPNPVLISCQSASDSASSSSALGSNLEMVSWHWALSQSFGWHIRTKGRWPWWPQNQTPQLTLKLNSMTSKTLYCHDILAFKGLWELNNTEEGINHPLTSDALSLLIVTFFWRSKWLPACTKYSSHYIPVKKCMWSIVIPSYLHTCCRTTPFVVWSQA